MSLIQGGDWKLMEFLEDGRLELYNLRDDIGETKNLAKANAGQSERIARPPRRLARGSERADADQERRQRRAGEEEGTAKNRAAKSGLR